LPSRASRIVCGTFIPPQRSHLVWGGVWGRWPESPAFSPSLMAHPQEAAYTYQKTHRFPIGISSQDTEVNADRTCAALRFHRNQPERNASNPRPRCILPRMPSRGPRGGPGVLSFAGAACSPAWVDNLDTRHDRPVDHEPNDPPPEKKRSLHTCRRPAKPWSPTDQSGLSFERPGASVTRLNERTTSAPNAAIISRLPWR
jgi:hypothetical protein